MIGGFGPEATLDYYRLLIETYRKKIKDGSIPEIIIYSMDVSILLNEGLLNIIKRMIEEDLVEGIILGCTELPLILTKSKFGIPFLNTTKIHVESSVNYDLE